MCVCVWVLVCTLYTHVCGSHRSIFIIILKTHSPNRFVLFVDQLSQYSPDYLGTHYISQASFKSTDMHASASRMLALKAGGKKSIPIVGFSLTQGLIGL